MYKQEKDSIDMSPPSMSQELHAFERQLDLWTQSPLWLRFSKNLERCYVEEEHDRRARDFLISGVIAFAMYATFLGNDFLFRREDFALAIFIRLVCVCGVAAVVLRLMYKTSSIRLKEWIMSGLVLYTIFMSAVLLHVSQDKYTHIDALMFGFFPMVGNILFRLSFPYALFTSLVSTIIMMWFFIQEPLSLAGMDVLASIMFFCTTGLSLIANHRVERSQRRFWLLRYRQRLLLKREQVDGERLAYDTERDALTNAFNRRYFMSYMERKWFDLIKNSDFSVIMIDVDYFKKYNDFYGHIQGDMCLKKISKALQDALGTMSGMVVRYGGEEFLILLESASNKQVKVCVDRICSNVRALNIPHQNSSIANYVTVSVGSACYKLDKHANIADLVRDSDVALYTAKDNGRDCSYIISEGGF